MSRGDRSSGFSIHAPAIAAMSDVSSAKAIPLVQQRGLVRAAHAGKTLHGPRAGPSRVATPKTATVAQADLHLQLCNLRGCVRLFAHPTAETAGLRPMRKRMPECLTLSM
jgi:hypothetical protein